MGSGVVLYWLKRDLRRVDNRALAAAAALGRVMPFFVIDLDILDEFGAYDGRLYFLLTALARLSEEMPVYVFVGRTADVFHYLLEKYRPRAVVTASSLSWSGGARQRAAEKICAERGVRFVEVFDNFLVDPRIGLPVSTFSAFWKRWRGMVDAEVAPVPQAAFYRADEPTWEDAAKKLSYKTGRFDARRVGEVFKYDFSRYGLLRDKLCCSTGLSPYIRFGVVSIRQVYAAGRVSEEFVRELAWREYWYALRFARPYMRDVELNPRRRGLRWLNEHVDAFFRGETGYPIIDAAVAQLKAEHWIHNRLRMLLASFFTKDLLADWRLGDAFFKKHLIDYDEVVDVGNWQWAASVGVDYAVRVFNPVVQARRLDPRCEYIKRWLPQLSDIPCRCLQDPIRCRIPGYPPPVVDHRKARKRALEFYARRSGAPGAGA
ncbi:MAG: FAD-binding domain-containing protein [Pyrobaculum sp.]